MPALNNNRPGSCVGARHIEKAIPPRPKFSFSLENFILGLKCSFSLENSIPGPFFLRPERGSELKNHSRLKSSFRIESLIFSRLPLEIDFFQSWGPLGTFGPEMNVIPSQHKFGGRKKYLGRQVCRTKLPPIFKIQYEKSYEKRDKGYEKNGPKRLRNA